MSLLINNKGGFDSVIEHLKHEMSNLRTGRATPALVEDIIVEAYGTKQPLKAIASISVADAKTITVSPWDKSVTQAIEVAINNSQIGINPVNDGTLIRLPLPDLTADRRKELVKVLHQKLEQARISIRKVREDIRDQVDEQEKQKELSEDEKYKLQEDLERMVKDYNEKIKQLGDEKEKEILTV